MIEAKYDFLLYNQIRSQSGYIFIAKLLEINRVHFSSGLRSPQHNPSCENFELIILGFVERYL